MKIPVILVLVVGAAAAIHPLGEDFFSRLGKRCKVAECKRRVAQCKKAVLENADYNTQVLPVLQECEAMYPNPARATLCAHIRMGEYKTDGTVRADLLLAFLRRYLRQEPHLLKDLVQRFIVCDPGLQASVFIGCVMTGCLSS
ncbi:uncharacterized protein [Panulirus ornatus]|uniref:uncharacterized protein n=1 Tax=Panulirus ornatus TaxID=150431 RepID=UPI003A852C1B